MLDASGMPADAFVDYRRSEHARRLIGGAGAAADAVAGALLAA
jgi:hypothetical protein